MNIKKWFQKDEPAAPKHTCGSWPDPYWTEDDKRRKKEAMKECPACIALYPSLIKTYTKDEVFPKPHSKEFQEGYDKEDERIAIQKVLNRVYLSTIAPEKAVDKILDIFAQERREAEEVGRNAAVDYIRDNFRNENIVGSPSLVPHHILEAARAAEKKV